MDTKTEQNSNPLYEVFKSNKTKYSSKKNSTNYSDVLWLTGC